MKDRTCGTCAGWESVAPSPNASWGGGGAMAGRCRMKAPIPGGGPPLRVGDAVSGHTRWPWTLDADWCLEWAASNDEETD